jgi:hypothetical protein
MVLSFAWVGRRMGGPAPRTERPGRQRQADGRPAQRSACAASPHIPERALRWPYALHGVSAELLSVGLVPQASSWR